MSVLPVVLAPVIVTPTAGESNEKRVAAREVTRGAVRAGVFVLVCFVGRRSQNRGRDV